MIIDDTIEEKAWSQESEVICWHFDPVQGRSLKEINVMTALYHRVEVSIPVDCEVIQKPVLFCDLESRQEKRARLTTKHEYLKSMVSQSMQNILKFRHVLMDSWFAAKENFDFIIQKKKHCIATLKSNRLVALHHEDQQAGHFIPVSALARHDRQASRAWLTQRLL